MVRKLNVIAIMSPKGGVGKTVTTANLASALAVEFNKKVLAIDTNVSTASLGLHLDIFYPKSTINDLTKKGYPVKKAIHAYNENLHVIPASIRIRKGERDIKTFGKNVQKLVKYYDGLLDKLAGEYDIVLLDCAPGLDMEAIATLHVAGGLIVVTNPDYPALVTAVKALEYAKTLNVPIGGIVLSKVENKKHELTKEEIENALGVKVIGKIPFDKKVTQSIAFRTPIVLFKPNSKSSVAYKKLAASMMGREYKRSFREVLGF